MELYIDYETGELRPGQYYNETLYIDYETGQLRLGMRWNDDSDNTTIQ